VGPLSPFSQPPSIRIVHLTRQTNFQNRFNYGSACFNLYFSGLRQKILNRTLAGTVRIQASELRYVKHRRGHETQSAGTVPYRALSLCCRLTARPVYRPLAPETRRPVGVRDKQPCRDPVVRAAMKCVNLLQHTTDVGHRPLSVRPVFLFSITSSCNTSTPRFLSVIIEEAAHN
jgi:hypothetical protein